LLQRYDAVFMKFKGEKLLLGLFVPKSSKAEHNMPLTPIII